MKKKGFTLIELIAVLVIMAIVVLIVVPLVMSIIRKSKENSLKRSVDGYGRAVELAAHAYQLDNGTKANSFDVLKVEYSGKEVSCDTKVVYQNNVYLSKCKVGNTYVTDSKSTDGYYHYGDITKYGNIYVKTVNRALKRYYNRYNKLPSDINELELNLDNLYFSCDTYKFNSDNTVYLSKCSIAGNIIEDKNSDDGYYQYGKYKYLPGDMVKYKDEEYYVVDNTTKENGSVHIMRKEPIKREEIVSYLDRTEFKDQIADRPWDNYFSMQYYYHDNCVSVDNITDGCSTDYSLSAVKQIVDIWTDVYLDENDLVKDSSGYKVRILNEDDLMNKMNFHIAANTGTDITSITYDSDVQFGLSNIWTSAMLDDSNAKVSCLSGNLRIAYVYYTYYVAPVINIKISALDSEE